MDAYTAGLFAAEPRLWSVRAAAAALEPEDWFGWRDDVMEPLRRLVGWYADPATSEALHTSEAYEAALRAMLDAWEKPNDDRTSVSRSGLACRS